MLLAHALHVGTVRRDQLGLPPLMALAALQYCWLPVDPWLIPG
ncbi:hypothetical protein HaLaN_27216, partial [Haematococcus lacustris]